MKLRFLGGVDEVGCQAILMEERSKVMLLDYGYSPHEPPKYPLEPPDLDALLLSHAHLDHSGLAAWVAGRQEIPIFGTPPTQRVTEMLARDSLKIARQEERLEPFSAEDIASLQDSWLDVEFGRHFNVGDLRVQPLSAGHIPGSTMFRIEGDQTTLFTGDLNTMNTRLMRGAKAADCDTLIMESTYSGKEHPPRLETEAELLDAVDEVVDRGGVAVVPAFAVSRSQEMLMVLKRGGFDTWYDGMGKTVTDIYLRNPGYLRDFAALESAIEDVHFVDTPRDRERALKGDVVVTTSGMIEGGPVLFYLAKLERDRRNALFMTGYQVEGTGGRAILDTGTYEIDGVRHEVECEVRKFDFSAHAGHSELRTFVEACDPHNVVLIHGDKREELAKELERNHNVILGKRGGTVEIPAPR